MITKLTAMDRLASSERKDRLFRSRIKTRRIINGRKQSMYIRKSVLLFSEELLVTVTFIEAVLSSLSKLLAMPVVVIFFFFSRK